MPMRNFAMVIAAGGLAGASVTMPTVAAPPSTGGLRCGWLINATPGNFDLVDRDGTWEIAAQGGYEA